MISKLSKEVLDKCIIELQKEENKNKINENVVNPLIQTISDKLYPYMMTIFVMYILVLILIISILVLLILNKKK